MKLVIIESPYAGDLERHVGYARECVRDSLGRGEAPFASHLFYAQTGVLDDSDARARAFGIAAGFAWARACDLVAFYVDLGWSPGMHSAFAKCIASNRPIEERRIG